MSAMPMNEFADKLQMIFPKIMKSVKIKSILRIRLLSITPIRKLTIL